MSTGYKIPLKPKSQKLRISLGGIYYRLAVTWNNISESFTLDILDDASTPILSGIPLVIGVDLLEQFEYMNFGGQLVLYRYDGTHEQPKYSDIGDKAQLYFVVL